MKSTLCTRVDGEGGCSRWLLSFSVLLVLGCQKIYLLDTLFGPHGHVTKTRDKRKTSDVTAAGCVYQGRAFVQSLPNCRSHCPDYPRTASYQWENCAEQPTCTRLPPWQTQYSAIISASPPSIMATMVAKQLEMHCVLILIALPDDCFELPCLLTSTMRTSVLQYISNLLCTRPLSS